MVERASSAGWVVLSAAAVAGVVAAHTLAYALALPDAHDRAAELHATGHGYWALAVYVAVAAGALTVSWAVARGARASSRPATAHGRSPAQFPFPALAVRQVIAFAVVEVGERAVAGAPVTGIWHERPFVLGIGVQVVVAAAVALVLRHAEVVASVLAARGRPVGAARRSPRWWSPGPERAAAPSAANAVRSRAPPRVVAPA